MEFSHDFWVWKTICQSGNLQQTIHSQVFKSMTSQNIIINYINRIVDLNEEESVLFKNAFKRVRFKKRQFLVQPNFINKHKYFILEGAVRAYVIHKDGTEHTVQ